MHYIVFDLEWNQADPEKEEARKSLPFEIIEIGAVKLDENLNSIDTFHRIIKPVVYTKLFTHTKEIVNLTDEDLLDGTDFKSACEDFLSWCGKTDEYRFCTWGPLDVMELELNMAYFNVPNPFPRPLLFANVQQLYALAMGEGSDSAHALSYAVKNLHIPENGGFHSALLDALYTTEIMKRIDGEMLRIYPAVDSYNFPESREEEITINYPDHSMYVTRSYETREALRNEESTFPVRCNICGGPLHRGIPWYTNNCKTYFTVAKCKKDGNIRIKRAIKSPDSHHFYEIQTIRQIDKNKAKQLIKHHRQS